MVKIIICSIGYNMQYILNHKKADITNFLLFVISVTDDQNTMHIGSIVELDYSYI